jgi:hypothetical protein
MKKPTKIILKLLNLIVLLILFGCEKDLYEEPIHQSKIKIEKFSVSDISSGKSINSYELLKSISKAKAKFKLSNNKIIYDSINDFYFDDENGYKISEDDKESYTFQLHRNQENELSKIENIIFSLNKEGYYDSFISKYIYTENEIKNKTIAELGDSEVIYTPIDSNKMELLCIDVITVYSGCTETHENGETCSNTTMTTTLWCGWLDSGGGGGGSGGSGSGSGSGGGGGSGSGGSGGGGGGSGGGGSANNPNSNTNSIELPILTMPVHGIQPSQTPCETLRDVIQNAKVALAIQALAPKTLLKSESAYQIERKYSSQTQTYTYTTTLKEGDNFNTTVQVGGYIKGQAHNHPENGQSIPSITDLKWLSACQENIYPASANAYNIVVCPNPASPNDPSTAIVYAVTVDNLETLTNSINNTFNSPDLVGLSLEEKYEKLNYKYALEFADVQNSATGMENKFLELYATFGISLYKFDDNANNWNKLNLQNNTVTPQPCEE